MHVFRDSLSIRAAAQRVPALADHLTWLISEVTKESEEELDLLTVVVTEPGDQLDQLTAALGFSIYEEGVENLTEIPGWFELTFIVNGEGYGYIVYVPDAPGTAPDLLAFCRSRRPPREGASSPSAGETQWFFDEQSGAVLNLSRYYGFGDAGGLAGSFRGYVTREKAVLDIQRIYSDDELGTTPEQLGEATICVLTGRQYVDRLRELDDLDTYGRFV